MKTVLITGIAGGRAGNSGRLDHLISLTFHLPCPAFPDKKLQHINKPATPIPSFIPFLFSLGMAALVVWYLFLLNCLLCLLSMFCSSEFLITNISFDFYYLPMILFHFSSVCSSLSYFSGNTLVAGAGHGSVLIIIIAYF